MIKIIRDIYFKIPKWIFPRTRKQKKFEYLVWKIKMLDRSIWDLDIKEKGIEIIRDGQRQELNVVSEKLMAAKDKLAEIIKKTPWDHKDQKSKEMFEKLVIILGKDQKRVENVLMGQMAGIDPETGKETREGGILQQLQDIADQRSGARELQTIIKEMTKKV